MKKFIEIFDIECIINYFLVVFYRPTEDKWFVYEISEWINQTKELQDHCKEVSWYIGFNNERYDCPLLEFVLKNKTNKEIYDYSDSLIKDKKRVYTKLPYIDVMQVNHFGINGPKTASLKKLAFNMRKNDVYDSPVPFDKPVLKSKKSSLVTYCKNDVIDTYEIYRFSKEKLSIRQDLGNLFNTNCTNLPDPSMGEKIFAKVLGVNPEELKLTYKEYPQIALKDIIFPFIGSGKLVDIGKNFFSSLILKPNANGYKFGEEKESKKLDTESKYQFKYTDDITTIWGLGGIHGAVPRGLYISDDKYIIKTFDIASQYPSNILNNHLCPILLGEPFHKLYRWFYNERFKYAKGTSLNAGFKLLLNLVFGKLNNEYSIFRDPKMFFTVTINNQLVINWLCDMLSVIPDSRLLTSNTDGCEIRIPKEYESMYMDICKEWESLTQFKLDHSTYNKLYIHNINNYIGQFESGKIKRKGLFCTYDDIISEGNYHKDTSMNVVALALTEYFINDINPETFIKNHTNIHDFMLGVSKSKAVKKGDFEFLLSREEEGIVKHEKVDARFIRYYASTDGYTACKLYEDTSIISLHSDTRITILDKIKPKHTVDTLKLNYNWYLNEVNKIINT